MFDSDRNLPIELPLYRIPNEVKKEIEFSLKFWDHYGPGKSSTLVERAFSSLSIPYGTTKSITNDVSNAINSNPQITKIKDGVEAFREYLIVKLMNAETDEIKCLLHSINETFKVAVDNEVKNI